MAIRSLKYHSATWLASDLAVLLEGAVCSEYAGVHFDGVAAVPLHPLRRRTREYNQSDLLASHLARRMGVPPCRSVSIRSRITATQTRLTAKERADNVRGAFQAGCTDPWRGKRILLVDDVMTTGATVNECSRSLVEAGVSEVWVITVARG